ncbi:mitochondrial metalloendopeptidase OMA1-like [Rhododendron vialii]|uniref:mitochondrial metalloendopeptidase OMA1-like n=1 Tax=Rhododendron vialii TaxID=182163 RepID=UPI00265E5CDD|nr:mitochondrial metalloendopeptidase OMA1-like [Rhododendron vialii]
MAFSDFMIRRSSKLPRKCSLFHYPNPQLKASSSAARRPRIHTELNDSAIAKQQYGGTILNYWRAEWRNSVTRTMSPARRYRHCPEQVALMTSSKNFTSSLGGESREKGGALGIQKTTIRESKLKNSLLLALHKVKLHLFGQYDYSDMCGCYLLMWKKLLRAPKIVLFYGGLCTTLFDTQLKRIPYSNRYHLLPTRFGSFGRATLEDLEESYKGFILPPNSPQTVCVKSILEEIVQAMHSGLRLPDSGKRCTRFDTEHLDGMKWEVMVVDTKDDGVDDVWCFTNGTLVVTNSLLEKLQSDAVVAASLGHEVGHVVARHILEHLSRCLHIVGTLPLLMFIPYSEVPLALVFSFISRRHEMEADYIGLMLMASAGYNPQLAPPLCEYFA